MWAGWPNDDLVVLGMICRYLEAQDSRRQQNHNVITNTENLVLVQVKSLCFCASQCVSEIDLDLREAAILLRSRVHSSYAKTPGLKSQLQHFPAE